MRHEIPAQLDPAVAVALKRVGEDWIIVYNPGLTRQARVIAVAEAHQYADGFEMGWSYQPPAGGVDVVIEDAFLGLAAVEPAGAGPSRAVGMMAAAVALPLTGCALLAEIIRHAVALTGSLPT